MERQWVVGGGVTMWAGAKVGETGSKTRMKTEVARERGLRREITHSQYSQTTNLTKRYMNDNSWSPPPPTSSLPSPVAMSGKTATRSPSSHGKCKEKQETVREWILVLNKSLSLDFFEWVLKIQSWQSAHGPWMEKDKRGAEVGGLSIVFVPFLSVLAL